MSRLREFEELVQSAYAVARGVELVDYSHEKAHLPLGFAGPEEVTTSGVPGCTLAHRYWRALRDPKYWSNVQSEQSGAPPSDSSRFDNPVLIGLLTRLQSKVLDVELLNAIGFSRSRRGQLRIGTLESGEPNARIIGIPDSNDALLLVDPSIVRISSILSVALARIVASDAANAEVDDREALQLDLRTAERAIATAPREVQHLAQVFTAEVFATRVTGACEPVALGGLASLLSIEWRHAMELFFIAHEYGHWWSGHLEEPTRYVEFGSMRLAEFAQHHHQEFQADAKGARLVAEHFVSSAVAPWNALWGIDLFFFYNAWIERCLGLVFAGEDHPFHRLSGRSHPPSLVRRLHVREGFMTRVPEALRSHIDIQTTFVWDVCERIWAWVLSPLVRELLAAGVPIRSKWQHHRAYYAASDGVDVPKAF